MVKHIEDDLVDDEQGDNVQCGDADDGQHHLGNPDELMIPNGYFFHYSNVNDLPKKIFLYIVTPIGGKLGEYIYNKEHLILILCIFIRSAKGWNGYQKRY